MNTTTNTKHYYLDTMGIQRWELRTQTSLDTVAPDNTDCGKESEQIWQNLEHAVSQCTQCELHKNRTQTVFGAGSHQAKLMLIGEAPGFYEDQQGIPFVGKAGQLLTAMLKAIALTREEVYIANVLKCRPPENRDPSQQEVERCTPYLQRQIELLQPKVVVALGRYAAHYLLECDTSLAKLRTQTHHYQDTKIPLIVTYHPAYLLRNPADKRQAYDDLLHIQKLLQAP